MNHSHVIDLENFESILLHCV